MHHEYISKSTKAWSLFELSNPKKLKYKKNIGQRPLFDLNPHFILPTFDFIRNLENIHDTYKSNFKKYEHFKKK